jgi:ABC-type sugar transport system permease subunit
MNSTTVPRLIMLHGIWYVTPFAMIVLFAGLQTLPKEPMEAATVDGANWFQKIWHVVIPHLRSLFIFIALISIMDAYRVFDSIFVLTKQNPIFDAETIMYYNFQVALSYGRLGKANAMSILTVIGIFIVLIPFLVMTYREQVEER